MNIHLIAIGGAVMHNLALALQNNGHRVSGSDDEIYEPAKSRIQKAGLLPEKEGWDASRIQPDLDVVILGMHARVDNPELIKAQELGLKIQSFPEFFAEHCRNKKRVVIAGSHGKTTTTAMIMHVLKDQGVDFDYLVGAQLKGFDTMVRLSDAPLAIIEGDEYLSSPIDRRSKFLWYKPDIAVITGIAWDHINVFPTEEEYLQTFLEFVSGMLEDSLLFVYRNEAELPRLEHAANGKWYTYDTMEHQRNGEELSINVKKEMFPLRVFGAHNLQNLQAAKLVCAALGISDLDFARSASTFEGAGKRLEKVYETEKLVIFRDFAHAPSKVKATTLAVREQYPDRLFVAAFELHTFSSLKDDFIDAYKDSLTPADKAWVYCDPHVFEMKRMPVLSSDRIQQAFGEGVEVLGKRDALQSAIQKALRPPAVLLLMSSGNFGGMQANVFGLTDATNEKGQRS